MPDDVLTAAEVREQQKKEVLEDITQMDGIISGEIPEPADTRASADDVEPTEPDGTGEEVVAIAEPEPEPVVEPTAEPVVEPAPVVDTDEYGLADFVNSMAREALGKKPAEAAPQPAPQAAPVQPVQVQPQPQARQQTVEIPADLISEADMTEAFQDPAKMITLITQVYARAVSDAAQIALTRLPSVIQPVVAQQANLISLAKELYKDNPELDGYRDFVQYCAVKVEDKHPDWSAKQIMQEAAKEAKARLPQLKAAVAQTKREASSPAFVGNQSQKGKNSPSQGRLSALEKEIAAMPTSF